MLGRKSIAERYFEDTPEEDEVGSWLVLYTFRRKPNPRFWSNMRRLIGLVGGGSFVQYSVVKMTSKRGVVVAVKIARHYGADVLVFKGDEVII